MSSDHTDNKQTYSFNLKGPIDFHTLFLENKESFFQEFWQVFENTWYPINDHKNIEMYLDLFTVHIEVMSNQFFYPYINDKKPITLNKFLDAYMKAIEDAFAFVIMMFNCNPHLAGFMAQAMWHLLVMDKLLMSKLFTDNDKTNSEARKAVKEAYEITLLQPGSEFKEVFARFMNQQINWIKEIK